MIGVSKWSAIARSPASIVGGSGGVDADDDAVVTYCGNDKSFRRCRDVSVVFVLFVVKVSPFINRACVAFRDAEPCCPTEHGLHWRRLS